MRVLYIGSKADAADSLNLEKEITELQRRSSEASGGNVNFTFLPDVRVEELHDEIDRYKPDILHISAHAEVGTLSMANAAGNSAPLTADALSAFLPVDKPPRVIYLNACNSQEIAKKLNPTVPIVIGTTAPITNRAARAGAVAFYSSVLAGSSIKVAFSKAQKIIETLHYQEVSAIIEVREGVDISSEYLHRIPRLIADFEDFKGATPIRIKNSNKYSIRPGIVGCPQSTTQIMFFTDDEMFIKPNDANKYKHLCLIERSTPEGGVVWAKDRVWTILGDFRFFAVGVTGEGNSFTVTSMLSEAIETRYLLGPSRNVPHAIADVISEFKKDDDPLQLNYKASILGLKSPERRKARKNVRNAARKKK